MATIDKHGALHAGDGKYTNKPQGAAGFDLESDSAAGRDLSANDEQSCPSCRGTGWDGEVPCSACAAVGAIPAEPEHLRALADLVASHSSLDYSPAVRPLYDATRDYVRNLGRDDEQDERHFREMETIVNSMRSLDAPEDERLLYDAARDCVRAERTTRYKAIIAGGTDADVGQVGEEPSTEQDDVDTKHSGPVVIRFNEKQKRVTVLCPRGHVVTGAALDASFAGSALEAQISSHQHGGKPWVVECDGA